MYSFTAKQFLYYKSNKTIKVRCVESIAMDAWGYSKLYLHVDSENTPAMKLYTGEDYHDVGLRWNPFWAGDSVKISYLVKHF